MSVIHEATDGAYEILSPYGSADSHRIPGQRGHMLYSFVAGRYVHKIRIDIPQVVVPQKPRLCDYIEYIRVSFENKPVLLTRWHIKTISDASECPIYNITYDNIKNGVGDIHITIDMDSFSSCANQPTTTRVKLELYLCTRSRNLRNALISAISQSEHIATLPPSLPFGRLSLRDWCSRNRTAASCLYYEHLNARQLCVDDLTEDHLRELTEFELKTIDKRLGEYGVKYSMTNRHEPAIVSALYSPHVPSGKPNATNETELSVSAI